MKDETGNSGYLGMRDGDLDDKPYAKYWNPDMRPLPDHVRNALLRDVEPAEFGFELGGADLLLEPGYLPMETGYTRLSNGQFQVCVLTEMPGVTAEMIDWWFGWHYMENERYKLWHPRAHLSQGAERMVGDDPDLTDREKYLHNPNYASEYVGGDVYDLVLTFSEPSDYLDADRFESAGIGTAICGTVGYQGKGLDIGQLIHLIRSTDDGVEMRSRFWLGNISVTRLKENGVINRIVGTGMVARRATPTTLGRDMLVHCASEMNHLAGFLPSIYADYHPTG